MTGRGAVVRFWDISRMRGFGGGAPDCRRLSAVDGPQATAGVKGPGVNILVGVTGKG